MKKKLFLLGFVFLFIAAISSLSVSKVSASEDFESSSYSTFIIGLDNTLVKSSTAYEGVDVFNPGLNKPSDIFIDQDGTVYIADTGNHRIYVLDGRTKEEVAVIKYPNMENPTGVCVSEDGLFVYVAATHKNAKGEAEGCVYKFEKSGNQFLCVERYFKPDPIKYPLFGKDSDYKPTKVAVDTAGNIFITSKGASNGILQLNKFGDFIGYFAPNKVQLTGAAIYENLFVSKENRKATQPPVTTNITVDKRNTVYSVIDGEKSVSLKKFNVNGTNILDGNTFFADSYQDITVDENGFIYAVENSPKSKATVSVIDPEGNLLFKFGNYNGTASVIGQFQNAQGVEVDSNGNIWVIDSGTSTVQVFMRTQYATTVMNALLRYNEGKYDDAVGQYNEVLKMNSSFVNAYIGLGKIAQRDQDYEKALEYFEIANYTTGYSEVFWEIRDNWMGKYLIWAMIAVIILLVLKIFHVYGKAYNVLVPEKVKAFNTRILNSRVMGEFKYLIHMLRHPFDTFYEMKFNLKIRTRIAWVLFVAFVVINILCDNFLTGYLFRNTGDVNLTFEILKWGLILLVFVVANYLISTLQNGEGFLRDVFIGTMFSFAPLLLFRVPLAIVSNFLTYNESYLYDLAYLVIWGWSIFNVILMLKDVHNLKLGELVLNILLTAVAMVVIVLIYLMVYILSMQFIQFFVGIIEEAIFIYG